MLYPLSLNDLRTAKLFTALQLYSLYSFVSCILFKALSIHCYCALYISVSYSLKNTVQKPSDNTLFLVCG